MHGQAPHRIPATRIATIRIATTRIKLSQGNGDSSADSAGSQH